MGFRATQEILDACTAPHVNLRKSTNIVDQNISLPIINTQGKVIGTVCFGVKVETLNQATVANSEKW